jgi:hypothetical protein
MSSSALQEFTADGILGFYAREALITSRMQDNRPWPRSGENQPVWVGHSCPTSLTLILILTLISTLTLTGKRTASGACPEQAKRAEGNLLFTNHKATANVVTSTKTHFPQRPREVGVQI